MFKIGRRIRLRWSCLSATRGRRDAYRNCATIFPFGGHAWKIGPLSSLLQSSPLHQPPRSSMKAVEHGCSRRMDYRGWPYSEYSPTSSQTLSPTSPRDVVTNGRARPRPEGWSAFSSLGNIRLAISDCRLISRSCRSAICNPCTHRSRTSTLFGTCYNERP